MIAATLRAFVAAAGAACATALLDRGRGARALLVECPAAGPVGVVDGEAESEIEQIDAAPLPIPDVRALPPLAVDAGAAELVGPVGAVAHMAGAVRELAGLLAGRSVVTVQWATEDPETPLLIGARTGDPLVLALGDEEFSMPPGWP